jgi:two-component system, OmpR family, sensor histidine kinase MtrB
VKFRRPGSRSLRLQVLATFAVGSILLIGVVSVVTYGVSRTYLFRQRRTYALRQTSADARLMDDLSKGHAESIPELLASLEPPSGSGSIPFLYRDGRWYSARLGQTEALIPAAVRSDVISGRHERDVRYHVAGPKLVVGIPLATGDGYFEVFPLHELARTLGAVKLALVAAALATLLGSLALGRFVLGRLLAPVVDIGRTARAIADGDRSLRLDVGGYEELADLVGSFNDMVDALNTQIERDARFASNVSHELRSPLTTLKTAVEGMERRRDRLDERSARLLTLLVEEVGRFEGMVTDLLEISRMDAARPGALRRQDMTVEALVAAVADRPGGPPVPVEIVGDPATVVRADPRRMARVVANLVRNAETHGRGLASVRAVAASDRLRIEVEDRGAGVPPEDRERIFERFYRRSAAAGDRGSGGGVGLGLALVAQHVRLHDGRVWVEDASPAGARFVVEIPINSSRSLSFHSGIEDHIHTSL